MWQLMPSPEEAEAGGFQVEGQPGLGSEALSQNKEIYSTEL